MSAHLKKAGAVELPALTEPFNPHEFFQTCSGLWIWDGFRNRILSVAKIVNAAPVAKMTSFNLVKPANDAENRAEMPKKHVHEDASAFCAHLAGMIDRQAGGKEGDLLTNGYANIFYVRGINGEVFVVRVYWHGGAREWDVSAYSLGVDRWRAGFRAFSSN